MNTYMTRWNRTVSALLVTSQCMEVKDKKQRPIRKAL